ncbi:MAG: glucokinase [Candidatus Rokuibacteriota bacterium]|nr:MAG: glucokinase [Candidatus Rokubacteria bacterium]
MILAGDVGGTKTAFGLFELRAGGLTLVREDTLPSREFPSLEAGIARFLGTGTSERIDAACFGVAGAVVDGRSTTTNLPWHVDERVLVRATGAARVKLLNDLEAAGHGILTLSPSVLAMLQVGTPRPGHKVLIAAGTGLGEAILAWDGRRHVVIASEGGHADFAPATEREIELLQFLRREFDHVSYERVLSGPGVHNVYRYLRERSRAAAPSWLEERLSRGDPSVAISEAGLRGDDPVCVETLDLFASVYGAEAGNLALKALALGGVYIGGGIAPKIRAKLEDGPFLAAFREKGRFAPFLADIPVALVLEPRTPLLGAAHVARELVG